MNIGDVFGPYTIGALIGAGGMGEVYRAHDAKLRRDVAIKVLPTAFGTDPERVHRLEREARVLAALNHPHIAAIYGVEEHEGVVGLVLELVEGETLARRIEKETRISVADALALAAQMADALDAAHERGIVHRDLKPGNIQITGDGVVKVLDFGLAKPAEADAAQTMTATRAGIVLGTVAYMSPEQARGQEVDKRADIWAFGCVLFEMLTGSAAFRGDSTIDVMAAVVTASPDWSALPADTPPRIRVLLERCLCRSLSARLRDIGDARLDLTATADTRGSSGSMSRRSSTLRRAAGAAILAGAVAALTIWLVRSARPIDQQGPRVTFNIPPPPGTSWGVTPTDPGPVVSPDGTRVAFVSFTSSGRALWVRQLDSLAARALPETQDVTNPFWSPDGQKLAYCAGGRIKKVDLRGRPPETFPSSCIPGSDGGWSPSHEIAYSAVDGLFRVPDAGGTPLRITTLDAAREIGHWYPRWLPDGRRVAFLVRSADEQVRGIYVTATDGTRSRRVVPDESAPVVVGGPSDTIDLLFVRGTTLVSQRLAAASLSLIAEPVVLAEQVGLGLTVRNGSYSASRTVLVHRSGAAFPNRRVVWVDRKGQETGTLTADASISGIALTPDEDAVTYAKFNRTTNAFEIWVADRIRGAERPIFAPAYSVDVGGWSPDGSRVAVTSNESGFFRPRIVTPGGAVTPLIPDARVNVWVTDWSRDGRNVLLSAPTGIQTISADQPGPPTMVARGGSYGSLSPDGRWLAYTSAETGQAEVYVQSFPDGQSRTRVSTAGGIDPHWRGDGLELFWVSVAGDMMAAAVRAGASIDAGRPTLLFKSQMRRSVRSSYVVTRDGQRFLINLPSTDVLPLVAVVNWQQPLTGVR